MSAKGSTESAHQEAARVLRKSRDSAAVEITRNLRHRSFHEHSCLARLTKQRSSLPAGFVPDLTSSRANIQTNGFTRGIQLPVPPEGAVTRQNIHRHTISLRSKCDRRITALVVRDRANRRLPTSAYALKQQAARPPGEGRQNVLLTLVTLDFVCPRVGCEQNVILLLKLSSKKATIFSCHKFLPVPLFGRIL
jgi:hypothetical protein